VCVKINRHFIINSQCIHTQSFIIKCFLSQTGASFIELHYMFIDVIDLFTQSYISSDESISHGDDGEKTIKIFN